MRALEGRCDVRRLFVTAPLVLLVAVLSGCTQDNVSTAASSSNRVVYCTIIPDAAAKDANSKLILGKGRYQCAAPADTLTMTVELQQQLVGGDWKPMVRQTFVAKGAETTRKTTQTVGVPCATGKFRSVVISTVTSGGTTTKPKTMNGVPVRDPCGRRL
jgi:hypothetical protein